MLIEQTTTYAYKLKYLANPSFDKVKTLAKKFIDELPKELVDDLFNAINRGVDILKTEPEMLVYLYSFGNMHKAKLDFAFDKIPEDFFSQPEINIIDYGCGQAIGTMCYADFLKSKNCNQKIKSVTLIEPSEICLKRAALHASVYLPDAEIVTVNKTFDELVENDINCDEDVPTLHILSNVLDLEFDVERFAELVKERLLGYNQFVCVGPYFSKSDKDRRMEIFAEFVGSNISFSKTFRKGEFKAEKNWTCQAVVASVGELEENVSTKVTREDIENGVEDEFGVVYSRDGKRLLKNKNRALTKYTVKKGTKIICDCAFSNVEIIGDCVSIPSSYGEKRKYMIQQVVLPNSVTHIGTYSFYNCNYLKNINLPNSLIFIGTYAFNYCPLHKLTIPKSVFKIGVNPFEGCTNIAIKSYSTNFVINNECLIDNQHVLISCFKQNGYVIIPDSVTTIGECAFCGCESLQYISIPNSVTTIGESAFWGCNSLQQITIPDSVKLIKKYTFNYCKSLQHIIVSEYRIQDYKEFLPEDLWDNLYYLKKAINQPNEDKSGTND